VYDAIATGATRGGARKVERVKDIAGQGFQTQNFIKIQIEHCDYAVADLTEMRPNVMMEAGYMFGCGHDSSDLLLVGQVGKSPTSFYGAHVLQYENASDLEVAVHEWFERRVG
jgi:nucleoside 2-deoxyribosyltransferase